jgi:hypothetical protein
MSNDIFGDLREWGHVLDELERLKASGELNIHQEALARLLRYRFNSRIRERAVESLFALSAPDDRILLLTVDIIGDENTELTLRAAAADALHGLIGSRRNSDTWTAGLESAVVDKLTNVLRAQQPPVLASAVRGVLRYATKPVQASATA